MPQNIQTTQSTQNTQTTTMTEAAYHEYVLDSLRNLIFPPKHQSGAGTTVLLLFVLILLGVLAYVSFMSSPSQVSSFNTLIPNIAAPTAFPTATSTPTPTPTLVPFPYQGLQDAYTAMETVERMEAQFSSDAVVKTSSSFEEVGKNVTVNVEGSIKGSTHGAPIITEMTIVDEGTGQYVDVGMAIVKDGRLYIKQPSSEGRWDVREVSEYPRIYENLPLDGSTFGFNLVETFFSQHNALFRGLDRSSLTENRVLLQESGREREFIEYEGRLNVPDYLAYIEADETIQFETRENVRVTLQEADIQALLIVDPQIQYVRQIVVDARYLSQIDQSKAEELGYDSRYDVQVVADFFNFNVPIDELVPEQL